jgi:hypothetical protein
VVLEDSDIYTILDWNQFRSSFGLSSAYPSGSLTQVNPAPSSGTNNCTDPKATGDDVEVAVDAEWASAAAPSATIEVASCKDTTTTFGVLIALQNLLNASNAPPALMSISYSECEAGLGASGNTAYSAAYQQAVTEGVSVFVSTGDDGASSCNNGESYDTYGIGISGIASTPYNVAVGGTDFGDTYAGTNSTYWSSTNSATYESALSYIPEIPWNDSCASVLAANYLGYSQTYGEGGFCNSATSIDDGFINRVAGSGGPSGCATGSPSVLGYVGGTCAGWAKPSWQSLVGNPSDGVRDIPDVALFAADGVWGHYYPLCISDPAYGATCTSTPDNWAGAGGTSFASPIMAGIQALVNQRTSARQGNPNPAYYKLAASEYGTSGDSSCNSTLGNTVGSSCIFHDVTQGDMDTPCAGVNCYQRGGVVGVLSTSFSEYQPAYGTTTGWDFASGIGSVNAANLVNNWPAPIPNFTLSSSPNTVTIAQGTSGTSTITVTPQNGFSGSVALSVSGLPSGVTASFSPKTASTSSTLTLKASATAILGAATVTINGKSGTLMNATPIALTVIKPLGKFTLTASPTALTVAQGNSGTSTITIHPTGGFDQNVTLGASGLPSGVTASFSPNPATSTSTLTLAASGSATVGKATIIITGTYTGASGSVVETTKVTLTVVEPNFTLTASPTALTVTQGSSGPSTITIKPTNTFAQSVTLSASGVPSGVTASFSPNPATSTSTLELAVSDSAAVGATTITITGTSGSLSHTTTVKLTVSK